MVVAAGEGGAFLFQQAPHHLGGFVQHVQAGADVWERVAVGGGFVQVPAGAEAELEAAAAQVIQGGCGLRQCGGVAVADVEHQAADAGVNGVRGQGAEGG